MFRASCFGLIFMALLCGCSSGPNYDAGTLAALSQVRVTSNPPTSKRFVKVEGAACQRTSRSIAEPELHSKALNALKADAISNGSRLVSAMICQEGGTDWSRNCWRTHVCSGLAEL